MKTLVAPSILSIPSNELNETIFQLKEKKANWIHVDIMDGKFVNNKTYDYKVLEDIKFFSELIYDVHLMVENPIEVVEQYITAGADYLTFHAEATNDVITCINAIKNNACRVGISIKPGTGITEILEYLPLVDLVLVMSVEPGAGGQSFIEESTIKIEELYNLRKKHGYHYKIQVDGGINNQTGLACAKAGVDCLVAGSYIFNGDVKKQIESLKFNKRDE